MADDVAGNAQPQIVGVQTLQLRHNHADILAALGHIHAGNGLHRLGIVERMGVGADTAHTLHQDDGLNEIALRGQLFDAAVVIADGNLGVGDHLTVGNELCVDRLLQRGMVRADGDDITHACLPPCALSMSSFMGVTRIWP